MCYINGTKSVLIIKTVLKHLPYKAMRRLGKHTTYKFQTHVELDAPSVMCS